MFQTHPLIGMFRTRHNVVDLRSGDPTKCVDADPHRVYLGLQSDPGNMVALNFRSCLEQQQPAYWIQSGALFEFLWEWHGVLVTLEWWATGQNPLNTAFLSVTEVLWFPD